MQTYKVTLETTITFEIDAPNEEAAQRCIERHFLAKRGQDPLAGARFGLDSTERQCANPQVKTVVANLDRETLVELA